jgi:hypothetical protein
LGCPKLSSITIPNKVATIDGGAFVSCTALTSVTFTNTIPSTGVHQNVFPGDLRAKFYAANATNGTAGTYTRSGDTWTKK